MCSISGSSTVDWCVHSITMDWGSFWGIKEKPGTFPQPPEQDKNTNSFPFWLIISNTPLFYNVWLYSCKTTEFRGQVKFGSSFSESLKQAFNSLYAEIVKIEN